MSVRLWCFLFWILRISVTTLNKLQTSKDGIVCWRLWRGSVVTWHFEWPKIDQSKRQCYHTSTPDITRCPGHKYRCRHTISTGTYRWSNLKCIHKMFFLSLAWWFKEFAAVLWILLYIHFWNGNSLLQLCMNTYFKKKFFNSMLTNILAWFKMKHRFKSHQKNGEHFFNKVSDAKLHNPTDFSWHPSKSPL